jgi:hypothetical protein
MSLDCTLDCLVLSRARREAARDEIRKNAYFKWVDAGRPVEDPLKFWREAELEWIEFKHIPEQEIALKALEGEDREPSLVEQGAEGPDFDPVLSSKAPELCLH